MLKKPPHRIVEIEVHRSVKRPRLAHAVALLFPCNHKKYLGLTLWKGKDNTNFYRTQDCTIIKLEFVEVMEKEHCKECPHEDSWIDSLPVELEDDIVSALAEEDF